MAKVIIPNYRCQDCKKFKHYGKYSCKVCSGFYSSEYKSSQLNYKQFKRQEKKDSPEELKKVYDWLRDNVFPKGYVLPSGCITFKHKRGYGGSCSQTNKLIKIGIMEDEGFNLYSLMLHEMLHLRLPHHRKWFKEKEKELKEILETKRSLIS